MKPQIKHPDGNSEFYIEENCYITEISNSPDDPHVSIAQARILPGETTRWHRLNGIEERYYILSGEGRVEIGELAPQAVEAGDLVIIPARCKQRITNIGTSDLRFLAICTPRFIASAYEEMP